MGEINEARRWFFTLFTLISITPLYKNQNQLHLIVRVVLVFFIIKLMRSFLKMDEVLIRVQLKKLNCSRSTCEQL